jgi:TolA-binding protein
MTTHLVKHQKLTKRQIKEDPLVTAAFRGAALWEQHGRKVLFGLAAIVLVGILGGLMLRARGQAEDRASGDLYKSSMAVQQADYASAVQLLKELIDSAPDTNAAKQAMVLLGDSYAAQGNAREAATWYRKALDRAGGDRALRGSSRSGLAAALEDGRNYVEAAATYAQIAQDAQTDNDRGSAMLSQARCLLAAGQGARATDLLRRILVLPSVDQTVTDPAKARLGEIQASQAR